MSLQQLAQVCQDAARDLAAREARPLPATVVLPTPEATRVTSLPGFRDEDAARHHLLARFAADVMRPANAACYGFLAEATVGGDQAVDVLVCAYGARRRGAFVTAAPLEGRTLGAFTDPEPLDEAALPFLAPLQRAADAALPE